jgi:hydroxypyruvate isomerase
MAAYPALRYEVNCSILFTELPLLRRPDAVRTAGFDAAEYWWPFAAAVPADREVDAFVVSLRDAGVHLAGLNFFAGDMAAGDRGLLSWPGRAAEFRDNVAVVAAIGEELGCRAFNALYGNRDPAATPGGQDELALENLLFAMNAVARFGGTVLLESVSGAERYPLRTAADAVAVVADANRAAGTANCRFLADLYHLTVNGDDLRAVITAQAPLIGHVQIADAPGRGAPGTGGIDFSARLGQLWGAGYRGWVGLEYKPAGASAESFGWLPRDQRPGGPAHTPARSGSPGTAAGMGERQCPG